MPPDAPDAPDSLVQSTDRGLYCPVGGFHIDPWQPVERAVITHGHADHARPGSQRYLGAAAGEAVLRERLGSDARLDTLGYGQSLRLGDATVSLHPAGHLLGSAQVRIEHRGRVAVVTGDYKREPDPTCAPFEPMRCHVLVTESTFGLPIYRWSPQQRVLDEINQWWRGNQQRGRTSILFAYSLGKAQRVLAGLDPGIGPIVAHGAVMRFVEIYRAAGIAMPVVDYANRERSKAVRGQGMVLAPPSAIGTTWLRRFTPYATGLASGWMQVRGQRRWRSVDRGFVLSDHVDWPGLMQTIDDSGAERIGVTHGQVAPVVRWLTEQGRDAHAMRTHYRDDVEEAAEAAETIETTSLYEPRSADDADDADNEDVEERAE